MATVSVSGTLRFFVDLYERITGDLGPVAARHSIDYSKSVESGTSTDQADLVWSDTRSVVSGAPDDLDIRGVLASALNAGINFVKITGIMIRNKSTTSGQFLTVGNGANPAFTNLFGAGAHTLAVQPGGAFAWYSPIDPMTTVAATGDIFRVAAATGTVSYDIVIIGRTA
jgi:hypothetical protein